MQRIKQFLVCVFVIDDNVINLFIAVSISFIPHEWIKQINTLLMIILLMVDEWMDRWMDKRILVRWMSWGGGEISFAVDSPEAVSVLKRSEFVLQFFRQTQPWPKIIAWVERLSIIKTDSCRKHHGWALYSPMQTTVWENWVTMVYHFEKMSREKLPSSVSTWWTGTMQASEWRTCPNTTLCATIVL